MQSFIIHMAKDHARAGNVAQLHQILPDAQVVEAVNGRDPTQLSGVRLVEGTLHAPRYPFALGAGEVGCFLSHRACWQKIAEGDAPMGLIAEDDLALDSALWADALMLAQTHGDAECFIRLPAKTREVPVSTIAHLGAAHLFVPKVIGLQTVCQVVGRKAAIRLLAATQHIDRPVDTTLQMHWATGQRVQTILPNGVSEVPGPSTIQKKTRTRSKLMREMRRARYRVAVARRPQRA